MFRDNNRITRYFVYPIQLSIARWAAYFNNVFFRVNSEAFELCIINADGFVLYGCDGALEERLRLYEDQPSGAALESVIHSFSTRRKVEKAHRSLGQLCSDTTLSDPERLAPGMRFLISDFVRALYRAYLMDLLQVFGSDIQRCDGGIYFFGEFAAQCSSNIIGAAARTFRTGIGLARTVTGICDGAELIAIPSCIEQMCNRQHYDPFRLARSIGLRQAP
jgi:hypothetical protein